MSINSISHAKLVLDRFATERRAARTIGPKGHSSWCQGACDACADQFETRLFFDPAHLKIAQQRLWMERFWTVLLRVVLVAGLATVASGYPGIASAEESAPAPAPSSEEEVEPKTPGNWFDWIFGTESDKGGSHDPETGTD
jgi:hypothetical protein